MCAGISFRLRSTSLGLRLKATTPQDDGTRQPNILSRQLSANNNHPDNESGLYCQHWFLVRGFKFCANSLAAVLSEPNIADMTAGIEAARLLVYQAAFFLEQSKPSSQQTAMAKLIASDLAVETCREALQIHGGYGYVKDYPVERLYRDALFSQIYNTTNETQCFNIAQYAYRKIK